MYPISPWIRPCLTHLVPIHCPHVVVTQLGVPEFITGEVSVFMDIMANFGTYFHQEEHRSEEQFLGVFLPRLQHTFPSGERENRNIHILTLYSTAVNTGTLGVYRKKVAKIYVNRACRADYVLAFRP